MFLQAVLMFPFCSFDQREGKKRNKEGKQGRRNLVALEESSVGNNPHFLSSDSQALKVSFLAYEFGSVRQSFFCC